MSSAHEGFADNWSYLRAELSWLDQVLMVAVARQRKQKKEIDRVAQSRADRVTHHWWKGIVALEGTISYDECRKIANPEPPAVPKLSFNQQMEQRIQASQRQGIVLGLPLLRDRLKLSVFEKNVLVIGLAPEINRRYARLYRYLKSEDDSPNDLPTVDLVLRLLCRNDHEWSLSRTALTGDSRLVRQSLLDIAVCASETRLNSTIKLADAIVNYLLADRPTASELDRVLPLPHRKPSAPDSAVSLSSTTSAIDWNSLVLPAPHLERLQLCVQRIQAQKSLDWERSTHDSSGTAGTIALITGASGTGKTMAAGAIAHALQVPLVTVDLSTVEPGDYGHLLHTLSTQSPIVLLIKSAQRWLGRGASLTSAQIQQFFNDRRRVAGVTLFSGLYPNTAQARWRQQMDLLLTLPMPTLSDRLQLWKQAFPPHIEIDPDLDWQALATHRLTGGQIRAIAHDAALYAASMNTTVSNHSLRQALCQRGHISAKQARKSAPDR